MLRQDRPIEIQNLLLEVEQLATQCGKASAHNLRHSFVGRIGNDAQQFLEAPAPDRRNDTKLGKVRTDRIDY